MKYQIIKDLNTLIFNKKSELKKYIFIIILIYIVLWLMNIKSLDTILGLNYIPNNPNVLSLSLYLISTLLDYYIILKIIEIDTQPLNYNIFSRIKAYKWLIIKIIIYLFIIIIIKLIEYIIIIILFSYSNVLINYFILEIAYALLIESTVIISYLFCSDKKIYTILLITSFILMPKTIINLQEYKLLIIIIALIINMLIIIFSFNKNNSFINLIGGTYDKNRKSNKNL